MAEGRTNIGGAFTRVDYNIANTGLPLTRVNPTALSVARRELAGASIGNFALFAGGFSTGGVSAVVDAYDTSLVRSTPTALSVAREKLIGASVGGYALFAGGTTGAISNVVDAYNTSLVRTTPQILSITRSNLAGASVGNYALFAGGTTGAVSNVVDAYDTSLVRSTPTALSLARYLLAGASNSSNAVFAGGFAAGGVSNAVDSYNSSLVRSSSSFLSPARFELSGASIGTRAIFAGGTDASNNYLTNVDVFDTTMTKTTTYLSVQRRFFTIYGNCGLGGYAIFGGGWVSPAGTANVVTETVDVSNNVTSERGFSQGRYYHAAANAGGRWLLFAGGTDGSSNLASVEAYAPAARITLPAGSKHQFSPATTETTVGTQTTITIPSPVSGYVKFKKGTVTAI